MLVRTDRSLVSVWWWTVDRMMLAGFALLMLIGIFVAFATSPSIASVLDRAVSFFLVKHLLFVLPAAALLVGTSLLAPLGVQRLGIAMLALFGLLVALTPLVGPEVKGATRWLSLGWVAIQPSEFVKPAIIVVVGLLLTRRDGPIGLPLALALVLAFVLLLVAQPDLGMAVVISAVFGIQLFVAGVPWVVVGALGAAGVGFAWFAYATFAHVRQRIDAFLDPSAVPYQIESAMRAVDSAGLFGRGPGEGIEKFRLPDAHTDFVFAATAEEFGIAACLLILGIFATLLLRGLWRVHNTEDRFCQLAGVGLVSLFGLQAIINMAVNLNLAPTKGMTLPFISYGGSSVTALAIGMGMFLALTRRGARLEAPR